MMWKLAVFGALIGAVAAVVCTRQAGRLAEPVAKYVVDPQYPDTPASTVRLVTAAGRIIDCPVEANPETPCVVEPGRPFRLAFDGEKNAEAYDQCVVTFENPRVDKTSRYNSVLIRCWVTNQHATRIANGFPGPYLPWLTAKGEARDQHGNTETVYNVSRSVEGSEHRLRPGDSVGFDFFAGEKLVGDRVEYRIPLRAMTLPAKTGDPFFFVTIKAKW